MAPIGPPGGNWYISKTVTLNIILCYEIWCKFGNIDSSQDVILKDPRDITDLKHLYKKSLNISQNMSPNPNQIFIVFLETSSLICITNKDDGT